MKIQNYDIQDDDNDDFVQLKSFMPNRCFRMLICAPSGGGKTNLLLDMIYRLLYFTNSRNKNCCCIYLSQSYYGTDKTIRLNSSHFCVFDFPSINEQSMICRELNINKSDYQKATKDPYSFLYVDKVKKKVARNFDERI